MRKEKYVSDSLTEQVHILMSPHINGSGRLFGGQLMEWIDVVAAVTARRHCGCNVTTAALDSLRFAQAAFLNELLVLQGRITHVGRTSMEVRVETFAEAMGGERRMINRAYFVMVALDENHEPTEVPRLIVKSGEEREEWDAAERRSAFRKQRRNEGF